jgi:putative hydrolase of the HAD superfamily
MIDRLIKAVLSDMYGTLLYEDGGMEYSYNQMAIRAGLDVGQFTDARQATFRDSLTGTLADGVMRAHAILRYMGAEDTEERAHWVAQAEIVTRIPAVHLYPATMPTLSALRRRGYGLGLISDCTYLWRGVLQRVGLEPMFDVVTLSNEVGTTKPDPRMYLRTIEMLGVKPEECLFVGDGGSDELEGAHALGIYAVLVDQQYGVHRSADGSYYDICIRHLGELLDLLPSRVVQA